MTPTYNTTKTNFIQYTGPYVWDYQWFTAFRLSLPRITFLLGLRSLPPDPFTVKSVRVPRSRRHVIVGASLNKCPVISKKTLLVGVKCNHWYTSLPTGLRRSSYPRSQGPLKVPHGRGQKSPWKEDDGTRGLGETDRHCARVSLPPYGQKSLSSI